MQSTGSHFVAVDYLSGNVWYSWFPEPAIKVMDRNLDRDLNIITDNLKRPAGIAVHPEMGWVRFAFSYCHVNPIVTKLPVTHVVNELQEETQCDQKLNCASIVPRITKDVLNILGWCSSVTESA